MKQILAFLLVLTLLPVFTGCSQRTETVFFHNQTFRKSARSEETLAWLEWYDSLSESDQMAISYIPADLLKLSGFDAMADHPAETN